MIGVTATATTRPPIASGIGDNSAEIGDNSAEIGNNSAEIGDNSAEIGDETAGIVDIVGNVVPCPAWKTLIRISLRGTASSADYI